MKSGSLNLMQISGPVQACKEIAAFACLRTEAL